MLTVGRLAHVDGWLAHSNLCCLSLDISFYEDIDKILEGQEELEELLEELAVKNMRNQWHTHFSKGFF